MPRASMFEGKPSLELNTIHAVILRGFGRDNRGNGVDVEISRAKPEPAEFHSIYDADPDDPKILPIPSPFTLPPDGDVTLILEVDELLSKNDRNLVYAVHAINADAVGFYVPPLVIKVAALYKGRGLSKEAGMYKYLESLQGIALPRCYGYFKTAVDHTKMAILPWDGPDCTYPRDPETFDQYQPPHPAAPLNMILLERLEPIITGRGQVADWIRADLFDLYSDLAQLGLFPDDWRVENIMYAPKSPPGLPGRPSARHNRVYGLRMIDLEHSHRTDMPVDRLPARHEGNIKAIINSIAFQGYRKWVMEQKALGKKVDEVGLMWIA